MKAIGKILFTVRKRTALQPVRAKSSRKSSGLDTASHSLRIYVQNIRTKQFSIGTREWSANPEEAYAFPNTVSAINFCEAKRAEEPNVQLMIHFGSPEILPADTSPRTI